MDRATSFPQEYECGDDDGGWEEEKKEGQSSEGTMAARAFSGDLRSVMVVCQSLFWRGLADTRLRRTMCRQNEKKMSLPGSHSC